MNLSYIVEELLSGKTIYRSPVPESSTLLMTYFVHFSNLLACYYFIWYEIKYSKVDVLYLPLSITREYSKVK